MPFSLMGSYGIDVKGLLDRQVSAKETNAAAAMRGADADMLKGNAAGKSADAAMTAANAEMMKAKNSALAPAAGQVGGLGDSGSGAAGEIDKILGGGNAKGLTRVPGKGSGKKDTVLAKVAPGEAILNKKAADMVGRGMIKKINKKGAQKMGLV